MGDAATDEKARGATAVGAAGVALLVLLGAIPFFVATTATGDDHVFLAFSRYAPNPLVAFVRDQHGGEFYRPLPMLLWWVLGRVARGSMWPFATAAFVLHTVVAAEVGFLLLLVRGDRRAAAIAALLFFLAPFTREAAYWYSASTDLLAAAFVVGAIIALLRRRPWAAALLFAGACWSKESAIVAPALAVVVLCAAQVPRTSWPNALKLVSPWVGVAVGYLVARTIVLHGIGGSGDANASVGGKLLQIGSGLAHAATASDVVTDSMAWTIGGIAWAAMLVSAARRARAPSSSAARPFAPFVWLAVALLPLLAAPWIIGARYFYLPAVGIAWLAADSLRRASVVTVVGILAALGGLDLAQMAARRSDVVAYDARVFAARRAVRVGLVDGATTFHIAAGIKDLDLAVKEDPEIDRDAAVVVLGDVPASFIAMPAARARELNFLLAEPPLPPSGSYRFGDRRIVALARRGDDPTLDEVLARLPGVRFIRLRLAPAGRVIARDVTASLHDSDSGE